jgi:zinc protease
MRQQLILWIAQAMQFYPETFTLANGLQVVVVTNRMAPVVSHMLWYRVGAADEQRGISGLAHYLEHLMFLGTEAMPCGQFSATVARNGGIENAFTSWDHTAYYQEVAVDRLPLMMQLEADRMINLQVEEVHALNERDIILEERGQRVDNSPAARLSEQMYATLFQNERYQVPIIGWRHEIAALTLAEAMDFYQTWYAPNNAVLIVSGDIDAAALWPMVEQTYGTIPSRPIPERLRVREPAEATQRRVILREESVQQPSWIRYYLAPSYGTAVSNQAYALQVLDEIFGAGNTSRLYRALVLDAELAVSAGTSYTPLSLGDTVIAAYVTPRDGVELSKIEDAFNAEVSKLLRGGITQDEVDHAKQRLAIQASYARDSVTSPAYTLGEALMSGQTITDIEAWPEHIAAVTVNDVMSAAKLSLDLQHSVTGELLPGLERGHLS